MEVTRNSSTIRLELASRPSCVTLVRGMLTGLGETLALDPELLDDLKTAVSEACNNVVMHAYPDGPGPFVVELQIGHDQLHVTVRDRGGGIKQISAAEDRMGVGLAVISALADRAEFQSEPDGGTAVRMEFSDRGAGIRQLEPAAGVAAAVELQLSGDVVVSLSSARLLPGVLGRIARAAAAVANFSLDRFSDLYLITDEISAHAESAARTNGVSFAIDAHAGQLDLTIGPFATGSSARLTGTEQLSARAFPLSRLVDRLTVESDGEAEVLSVVVRDKQNGPGPPASSDTGL